MKSSSIGAPLYSMVSLFAGAGGLDVGLESAGFTTFVATELEEHRCETLKANQLLPRLTDSQFEDWFGQQISQRCYQNATPSEIAELRDRLTSGRSNRFLQHAAILKANVRELDASTVADLTKLQPGELSLIAGGPPCQPFSRSGKRETVTVEDGRLFLEFVRLVAALRPRWFLFENVKGLILHSTDVVRASCLDCFASMVPPFEIRARFLAESDVSAFACRCGSNNLNWSIESKVDGSLGLILAEFERIGYACSWRVLNAADFGAPQIRERLFIVGSRDGEHFDWPAPTNAAADHLNKRSAQRDLFAGSDSYGKLHQWRTVLEACWSQGHSQFGVLDRDRARLWVKNVVRPHAEPVTWTLDRPSPTVGAHQAAKLAIAPEGVPPEQLLRQQWHVKGKRQGDHPPVQVTHAYLTDAELLTLQTFPAGWYLFGTRMERAFQIGNAVPAVLAKAVGCAILRASSMNTEARSASDMLVAASG
jgi:DNA (cytosine-5)-methyltransferase 1